MKEFEYLLAFESILYGLLVTKFLDGWNTLLVHRKEIKFYWPHTLLSISLFLGTVGRFKSRFYSPDFDSIGPGWVVLSNIFLPIALIYFTLYQLFPPESKGVDLKEHLESDRLIFLGGALFMFHGAFDVYFTAPNYPFPVYGIVLLGVLWIIPFLRYHVTYVKFLAILMLLITIQQLSQ